MKKLDEIMELMADEMADFKSSLESLEDLSNKLHKTSVPLSTEVLEKHLNSFLKIQKQKENARTGNLELILSKLERAYILPKSLARLLLSILLALLISFSYLTYKLIESQNENRELNKLLSKEISIHKGNNTPE
ncbi:DUF6730 family protein [Salegentibacter flavus]|uniref:Uncharacterized protein n=1 Tax=Salegentibacter flavus TaxID=287099 RepID=A0A1I4XXI1_9FLAO|nr:DUF6730 family protein [Salegentibacter flavus]SFN30487.1 hypothetical protein SAMN05660413_00440 [Salegentibacter flavus]